jgi:S1-C subfamily serine protease
MQQRDVFRATAWVVAAGVGGGLALAGAALTGHLGGATTVQQIAPDTSAAAAPAPAPPRGLSVQEIYRQDAPGVVQIRGARVDEGGLGSGFVIDKAGHIVTSNKVISGSPSLHVRFSGTDDLEATVIGRDPSTDVAVLQVDAHSRSLSPLPLGDSDLVQVGDPVVAIGNTRNVDRTATVGVVSGVQHGVDAASAATPDHAIQTDASIDRASSGGPLINGNGQVIGVSSRLGFAGVGGFAIPIDTVKQVVAQLLETGTVQHVFLGIETAPVTRSLAGSFSLPCEYGLLVQSVSAGSSAARAGLRAGGTSVVVAGESYRIGGDIIVGVDGKPVTNESQLRNVLQTKKPGDRLSLQIWRGVRKETVKVTLDRPPA